MIAHGPWQEAIYKGMGVVTPVKKMLFSPATTMNFLKNSYGRVESPDPLFSPQQDVYGLHVVQTTALSVS